MLLVLLFKYEKGLLYSLAVSFSCHCISLLNCIQRSNPFLKHAPKSAWNQHPVFTSHLNLIVSKYFCLISWIYNIIKQSSFFFLKKKWNIIYLDVFVLWSSWIKFIFSILKYLSSKALNWFQFFLVSNFHACTSSLNIFPFVSFGKYLINVHIIVCGCHIWSISLRFKINGLYVFYLVGFGLNNPIFFLLLNNPILTLDKYLVL